MSLPGSQRVRTTLHEAAWAYVQLGFSVIPVQGDRQPAQAKVAAIDWKPFQSRRARQDEVDEWFLNRRYVGLAIVTGRISNLVVLDFDDEALADHFKRRFPSLAQTRIIRSAGRNLPHYYYRLPVGVTLASRRMKGLDVQSDGRYVLAPPTRIGESEYRVEHGGSPRLLTRHEVERIQAFCEEIARVAVVVTDTAPVGALSPHVTPDFIRVQYESWCHAIGRNHALFRASLLMRDAGWSADHAMFVLVPLHITSAAADETALQREREAAATIRSAYSRPRRIQTTVPVGLPTTVREALLRHNQVALLRVLDGLLLRGVPGGALLAERAICDALQGIVGRFSVLQALRARVGETFCFETIFPFPTPHTPTTVATDKDEWQKQNCSLLGVTSPDKNRGRPAKQYRIPTIQQLCAWLNVKFSTSDPLTHADLVSPAQVRRGIHREFIKRRPGTYHIGLVARRLNVVDRTCQRYNRVCGVTLQPTYDRVLLRQEMLYVLKTPLPHMLLEDDRGKRYPCCPNIAQRLLSEQRSPRVCFQRFNHYTHPDGLYIAPGSVEKPLQTHQEAHTGVFNTITSHQCMTTPKSPPAPSRAPAEKRPVYTPPEVMPDDKRFYRRMLRDFSLELAAVRLYHHLRDLAGTSRASQKVTLSMATARKLALQYGATLIVDCQRIIQSRDNITNYAGFVVSFLRSETTARRLGLQHLS